MSSKLHCLKILVAAVTVAFPCLLAAQAQTPAPAAQPAPTATLHGHIADPTGALIPGANITIANALGVASEDHNLGRIGKLFRHRSGARQLHCAGDVDGFAPFTSPTIKLEAGQSKRVDISMAIEAERAKCDGHR